MPSMQLSVYRPTVQCGSASGDWSPIDLSFASVSQTWGRLGVAFLATVVE